MRIQFGLPDREKSGKMEEQLETISNFSHLESIINALPYPVLILNSKRQIVFSNKGAIEELGAESLSDFLGKKPGEAINCNNSHKSEYGCGTSRHCQLCGIFTTILKSQREDRIINADCRIISGKDEDLEFYNYEVSSTPISFENEQYLIISLVDNTDLKKKEMLEKLFYHDLLNTAGNIRNLFQLIRSSDDQSAKNHFMDILDNLSKELVDEIQGQRHISSAERGELNINLEEMNSLRILKLSGDQFNNNKKWDNPVIIDETSEDVNFKSDRGLVARILKNMIKNALEASGKGSKVKILSRKEDGYLEFQVNNPEEMPENVKIQVFQKSFSTKSKGRGYGTYSMKLLGEKYLGGKVSFTSNSAEGTTFTLCLPLD